MAEILIIGATSAIAKALARRFATQNASLYLMGRNAEKLTALSADFEIRGAVQYKFATFNANDLASHKASLLYAIMTLGGHGHCINSPWQLTESRRL